MSIQTELTRITNAKAAIKAAIEGKGVTVPTGTLLDGMASLIESIEAGGGSSWTDSYSVFATGTFTPAENATAYSIDTGVPFDCSNGRNYLRQLLIVWREPDETTISGLVVCAKRGYVGKITNGSSRYYVGGAIGSSGGITASRPFIADSNPFPQEGETTWTITDLNTGTSFKSGKPYRWILLGALK